MSAGKVVLVCKNGWEPLVYDIQFGIRDKNAYRISVKERNMERDK